MEKSIIETMVTSISVSPLEKVAEDHQIWEETDGEAHFKVTRHQLPVLDHPEFLSLSVSGEPSERTRIVCEFAEVFGQPTSSDVMPDVPENVDVVAWLLKPDDGLEVSGR